MASSTQHGFSSLQVFLILGLAGCGGAGGSDDHIAPEAEVSEATASDEGLHWEDVPPVDPGMMPDPGTGQDGGTEESGGLETIDPDPVQCMVGEACNAMLLGEGLCPGACIPQEYGAWCGGTVVGALCFAKNPPVETNQQTLVQGILVTPYDVPDSVQVGYSFSFLVKMVNTTDGPLTLPFAYKHPDNWVFLDATFEGWEEVSLEPGEETLLEATVLPMKANLFTVPRVLMSFQLGGEGFELFTSVGFLPGDTIACSGIHFPKSWSECEGCSTYYKYYQARCCDDVFYPGNDCCVNEDCYSGSCMDGRCVQDTPEYHQANNLPLGNQRGLMIVADLPAYEGLDPCVDRVDELGNELGLSEAMEYLDEVVFQRTLIDFLDLRWHVVAGIESDDFHQGTDYTFWTYYPELEDHLAGLGCIPATDTFDKVVVVTPLLDLGKFTGHVYPDGRVGLKSPYNPYLQVHELAHTFGARDLYLDMAGKLHFMKALMGNNLGSKGDPEDAVMWAEMGMGDVDRNGIIDLAEFAADPDAIVIRSIEGRLTFKDTLELEVYLEATEDGQAKKVLLPSFTVGLPFYGVEREMFHGGTAVFDSSEVDLVELQDADSVQVAVKAEYGHADGEFQWEVLVLDAVVDVPLTEPE